MLILAVFFLVIYSFFLVLSIYQWYHLKAFQNFEKPTIETNKILLSVIIPVRNEEESLRELLESLLAQTLEKKYFEVWVIDDDSDDKTLEIAHAYTEKLNLNILYLTQNERGNAPKKAAICKALKSSTADLIFCTDGDCVLPPKLLETTVSTFEDQALQFLSGPVSFKAKNSLWNQMQVVEFASLVGTGAVAIAMKKPNMCSGANIAYRKAAFYEVNGYEGNLDLASGDDEFLMHKISKKYKNSIGFSKNSDAIVLTNHCPDLYTFYQQRKRWAGKWRYYASPEPAIVAIFIFLVNFFTLYLLIGPFWWAVLPRFILEWVFLGLILSFLKKRKEILFIPLVQVVYPFYVLFFGLVAFLGGKNYQWKKRKLK
jgi:biofilm PGA synthesis N-glycosyltransferase PgaC